MREQKKHWKRPAWAVDKYGRASTECGIVAFSFANAKRKVTCKNCLRAMGVKI